MRIDDKLTVIKEGDSLCINGETFDFSPIPEGATLPKEAVDCLWLASDVDRVDGSIVLTLVVPHGSKAPKETLFPGSVVVESDGEVDVPIYETIEQDQE